ncbi:MAG: tRNA pseudouridine(38-40) synthase TruA [gamma proteobacterium symbiont of Bathyaustriella thionipta]|nr:tRNA pseudouridine(38-40) synthase TruA [gamma proteobacterium symbiont of Bathyaustriella thionipta]MCU7950348.1 tRNA pseudouridine(38-40) synthase TruA [gamma proteobacterium symbiont of Bathyaustriella thionipta]MCU7954972.1 tRNA pseudouridine(38-40) synthase TruA [gamma proteobacterium symbiont of Bathyaustriella thionipta]MCU7956853.1 tRNA pseudouridine(38-40) synthase TruA [gamma proteobacterium symbiont of Bathyaustriella thionipta]MCU7967893.1 tRNA pseudouridine(38-40) synthase TruA 
MRIALGIEYDGFAFSGWQIQDSDLPTVQGKLESALSLIANETVTKCQVAGRTDAGVHATEQVIHFDTSAQRTMRSWVLGANRYLTDGTISVLWAHAVDNDFHARFSAQRRQYRYVILSRPIRPTFLNHRVSWDSRALNLSRMQEAAKYLVGEHNFNSFRTVKCQAKSAVKNIYFLNVSQHGEYFYIDIEANSFLHHMVRNIAGVLMAIGSGEAEPEWAVQVLEAQDRTKGGKTAPPGGLYLTNVAYDKKFNLPQINSKTII